MNEDREMPLLDLKEILQDIWKGKFFIIALMIIFGLIMGIRMEFFVKASYTADGVLYIYSQNISELQQASGVTGSEIKDARTMSTTYLETLKLRSFLTEVSNATGGVYSWKEIKNMMRVASVNETEYVSVSVTADNPQMAYKIAKCICEKAQGKFSEIFKSGEAIIVDEVTYPKNANNKGTLNKIFMSLIFGALLGVAIIVVINIFDRRMRKSEEISKKFNISILGETILYETAKNRKDKKDCTLDENDKIIDDTTDFDTVETYKAIRTNVMFSLPKQDRGKVIAVTSASPGEGKTTTSINLALIFAQMGVNVLLVDCDLRKPRVHRYLGLERGIGVSNVICGYSTVDNVIHKDVRDHLDVITAGDIPPNPAELFENQSFAKMIEQLQSEYEYIFIDTPPITVVTDATVVIKNCTGAILVARQGVTITDLFAMAVAEAKKSNVKILGAIFHDSKDKHAKHNYYIMGKYGYRDKYKYIYKYKYNYNYHYGDEVESTDNSKKKKS